MQTDDVMSAEERVQEVARILVTGLLRWKSKPQMVATANMPVAGNALKESADFSKNQLHFCGTVSNDPPRTVNVQEN